MAPQLCWASVKVDLWRRHKSTMPLPNLFLDFEEYCLYLAFLEIAYAFDFPADFDTALTVGKECRDFTQILHSRGFAFNTRPV